MEANALKPRIGKKIPDEETEALDDLLLQVAQLRAENI